MYLISAADHTSVKRRRRPTAPPHACRPRICVVDGDVVGDAYIKANTCIGCGWRSTKSGLNSTDVN